LGASGAAPARRHHRSGPRAHRGWRSGPSDTWRVRLLRSGA
jgi:hypothetical protein